MGAPMSSFQVKNPEDAFLTETWGVAISFWIISIAMIAATAFFFAEAGTVLGHWKTSLHVGGLVTLVAGVHYMYMREYWVQIHKSPIVYRYIDWSITVPLAWAWPVNGLASFVAYSAGSSFSSRSSPVNQGMPARLVVCPTLSSSRSATCA